MIELLDLQSVKKGDLIAWAFHEYVEGGSQAKKQKLDYAFAAISKVTVIKKSRDGRNIKMAYVYTTKDATISHRLGNIFPAGFNARNWRAFKIDKSEIEDVKKIIDFDSMFKYEDIKK